MTQISLFDGDTPLKITKPIRLIELFAGYGSQSLALKYLGVPFEHWKICEWAVKSIQAYKDLHFGDDTCDYSKAYSVDELIEMLLAKGISADYNAPMTREQIKRMGEQKIRTVYNNIIATNNLVSVCNTTANDLEITDTDKYTYIMTYSFPCQDLSKAGNGAGMAKGSGTRSGMLWEVERILDECNGNLPQILLMENVPDVIGANNIKHFAQWVKKLEQLGYTSKWQCLNAKDYGVPQNRDRCFMVSWLGNHYYDFPIPIKLEKRLKDVLETNVDEKYYLSSDIIKYFEKHTDEFEMGQCDTCVQRMELHQLNTLVGGGNLETKIVERNRFFEQALETAQENDCGYGDTIDAFNKKVNKSGVSPTVTTRPEGFKTAILAVDGFNQSIRADQTCFGTITRNAGADLKRNGQGIIEIVDEPLALDEQNGYVRQDGTVGTLTTDGSSPKHNNRVIYAQKQMADSTEEPCGCNIRQGGEDYYRVPLENVSRALRTFDNAGVSTKHYIRKLTPKECGRLMGVRDDDIDTMSVNQSNSSLYHCFGDSIVVDVLMAIFKQML